MNKNAIKIVVVVVCLAVAGFIIASQLKKSGGGSKSGEAPLMQAAPADATPAAPK